MKHRETEVPLRIINTQDVVVNRYQRHKSDMKKPRQDDGALRIGQKNIRKTAAANPKIFAEHRHQIVHKHVTPILCVFHPTNT